MCRLVQIVIFKEATRKLISAEILSENLHHETWPVPCPHAPAGTDSSSSSNFRVQMH